MKRSSSDAAKKKYFNKKPKLETNPPHPCIYLPMEILEEIINKLPFEEFGRVRGTNIQFRNAADNILMRKLKHNLRMFDEKPSNVEYIHSKIIYQLAWPYLRHGYRSSTAALLLSVTNIQENDYPLPKLRTFIGSLLYNFCKCIDFQLGNLNSQESRLLYVVTTLGFLNKLTNTDRTEKRINSQKMKFKFTVNGAWFGLLGPHNFRNMLVYPGDRNYVLLFLADILASNISGTGMRNKWYSKGSNRNIVYGIDDGLPTDESVLIEIIINGSNKVQKFLRTAPCVGGWDELPTDHFLATLNIICITCKQAHKMDCPTHTICSLKI